MTSEKNTYFRTGIRLALPPAIISCILFGMISLPWMEHVYHSIIFGAGSGLTVFILVYLIALQNL